MLLAIGLMLANGLDFARKSAFCQNAGFDILRRREPCCLRAVVSSRLSLSLTPWSFFTMLHRTKTWRLQMLLVLVTVVGMVTGCGTTKSQQVTDQMLMSNAIDRTVSQMDFGVMKGRKAYLDTRHIKTVKGPGFVNADYIISSLRQQMFASGVRLMDKPDEAQYIIEARVGALGTDGHDVTYGLPASNTLSTAASLVPNAPAIPAVPELSIARRQLDTGGAKIALFAYDRESKRPVWQSGTKVAISDARNIWVLGAGPFQRGTIYDGTQFAGSRLQIPLVGDDDDDDSEPQVAFEEEHVFSPFMEDDSNRLRLSSFVSPVEDKDETAAEDGKTKEKQ